LVWSVQIIPGFLFASVAIYVVSLMGKGAAASIQQASRRADAEYRAGDPHGYMPIRPEF